MKASRQSAAAHWRNVGRTARRLGYALEVALTTNAAVNALIRAGYDERRKGNR